MSLGQGPRPNGRAGVGSKVERGGVELSYRLTGSIPMAQLMSVLEG